jgi:hypothetical protein
LQDAWKCTIGYDTVWKGKEKATTKLYGSWEASFGMLFNWKTELMRLMPNGVVKIDVEFKDGMPYFQSFSVLLVLALMVFWMDVDHSLV